MPGMRGFVGSDDDGTFAAHVEHDRGGPFCFLNGPRGVSAELAVQWAREHASTVLLRIGDELFSAGRETIDGLPRWTGEPDETSAPAAVKAWTVRAAVTLFHPDLGAIVESLVDRISVDPRATGTAAQVNGSRVEFSFSVRAAGPLEAHETAAAVLRDAWEGLDDRKRLRYDASSIVVIPQ